MTTENKTNNIKKYRDFLNLAVFIAILMIVRVIDQLIDFYLSPLFLFFLLLWMIVLLIRRHGNRIAKVWVIIPFIVAGVYFLFLLTLYLGIYFFPQWEEARRFDSLFLITIISYMITALSMGIYLTLKSIQKRLEASNEEQTNSIWKLYSKKSYVL